MKKPVEERITAEMLLRPLEDQLQMGPEERRFCERVGPITGKGDHHNDLEPVPGESDPEARERVFAALNRELDDQGKEVFFNLDN